MSATDTRESTRKAWLGHLPLRIKITLSIAIIFASVVTLMTTYNHKRENHRLEQLAIKEAENLTTMYFDSINTLMMTGTMDQRAIFRNKMIARPGVVEARLIRGEAVVKQFGPGDSSEQPMDQLDLTALTGKRVEVIRSTDDGRVLTVITPFKATKNTRGVDCLGCHQVTPGTVNGAARISISLNELDAAIQQELLFSIIGNLIFFAIGLLLINYLMKLWVVQPLNALNQVLHKRAEGDTTARSDSTTKDEIGQLAHEFNAMADANDDAAQREIQRLEEDQRAANELREKVNSLLNVMHRVAEGDFGVAVPFTSDDDAIGDLASQLQIMITYIHTSIDEKREAMAALQRRVDQIKAAVSRAAEGDLTGIIEVDSQDAIGQLAQGVQAMIDSLSMLVAQVQRSGIQVASSANSIAATAKEQEATVAEQAATTNEIVTTATEITATAKELLSTMDQVSSVADSTAKSASSGREGLSRMENTMHQVVQAVGSIAGKFEVLSEKASNISAVVTTITKVADQTNLLSLNAAIEAEKAGEYGFGFSVVAKEIRRLADQTAVATLDIEQMVKEMQSAVSAGVMSMEKFSDQVRHSVNDVRQISSQFGQIIEQVQALTPRFETVHQGMHFQSQGAEHINHSMIQLNEAAQQTVESLRESNYAIERLNDAARDLQNGVTKFKVRK